MLKGWLTWIGDNRKTELLPFRDGRGGLTAKEIKTYITSFSFLCVLSHMGKLLKCFMQAHYVDILKVIFRIPISNAITN